MLRLVSFDPCEHNLPIDGKLLSVPIKFVDLRLHGKLGLIHLYCLCKGEYVVSETDMDKWVLCIKHDLWEWHFIQVKHFNEIPNTGKYCYCMVDHE